MGCLFPSAPGLREYWRLLRTSKDGVTDVPPTHWSLDDYFDPDPGQADLTYCRRGAFLAPTGFDPTEFGIPPTVLEATDTAQLLGLVVAKAALEDAGYGAGRDFDRTRTSVILGVTGTLELVIPLGARRGHPKWRQAMRDAGGPSEVIAAVVDRIANDYVGWQENSFPGLLGNVVAGRIANRLDLKGTNCVVDAACASSLSAIHLAMLELASGRTDMVLSGGVDALNDIFMFMCFSKTQALSSTGDSRPFSKDADGTVIGEGLGMVVLKRLADAERDGDRIYSVIRGIGTSSDGRSQSIYAPRATGQTRALRDAYSLSGVDPATVELVEAHGTGTKVGDAVEFDALKSVYAETTSKGPWCALGSVKSQIGHTKAAAGAAGLIKAALALHHRVLPATLKISAPNPRLQIDDSPFYLNTETRPWLGTNGHPRRSSVSAFGFGGSNFHAVLEEYAGQDRIVAWDGSTQIVALSADSFDALQNGVAEWRTFIQDAPDADSLAFRALESRRGFSSAHTFRLVLVLTADTDPGQVLGNAAAGLADEGHNHSWSRPGVFFGGPQPPESLVFLFPGQASQYVGMGRDLTCMFPEAHDAIASADASALAQGTSCLSDRIFPLPVFDAAARAKQQAELTRTDTAQPAIGAVSLAMRRVLHRFGIQPDYAAGHSYGELVALRAANRITDDDLRQLSTLRGQLMAAGPSDRGTMAAVQAPLTELAQMLEDGGIDVVLANRNSPSQGVLSGTKDAIAQAVQACADRGWSTTPLQVAAAFHSPLMQDAVEQFRHGLNDITFSAGTVPVYANCSARPYADDTETVCDTLASQLVSPVQFVDELEHLYAAGVRTFVEVGPGNVLTKLVRATLGDRPHQGLALDASSGRRSGITDLGHLLAQLGALGHPVDLTAWEPHARKPRRPKMNIPLLGANYRSPQPTPPAVRTTTDAADLDGHLEVSTHPKRQMDNTADGAMTPAQTPQAHETTRPHSTAAPVTTATAVPPDPIAASDPTGPATGVLQIVQEGLRAMQTLQQQTAEAHLRFLEGQESAHKTIQLVMEGQQRLIEGGSSVPQHPVETAPHQAGVVPPPPIQPPVPPDAPQTSAAPPLSAAATNRTNLAPTDAPVVHADTRSVEPLVPQEPPSPDIDLPATTLLEVVAELTGYPIEMLDLDMDLEADLGIDSIKRLEILAGLQTRIPEMVAVDSTHVGSLRTLRNIIDYMNTSDAVPDAPPPEHAASVENPAPPTAEPDASTQATETAPSRRVLRATELPPLSAPGRIELAVGREVWIVDDGTDLAQALCDQFAAQGRIAHVVSDAGDNENHSTARIGGLIVLGAPEDSTTPRWSDSAETRLKHAFSLTKRVGPMLREAAAGGGALFATVSRMDGAFGLNGGAFDPVQGGLAGLTKTISLEWSALRCKALDVSGAWTDSEQAAAAIVAELAADGPIEIGLDGTHRHGLELISAATVPGPSPCRTGDVVVLSGGARGVTAEVACALATENQPTLVLLGRSPEPTPEPAWLTGVTEDADIKRALLDHAFQDRETPTPTDLETLYRHHIANREIAATMTRIEQAGSQVVYRSVDVRDGAALATTLGDIRRNLGPIRGLIHAAGVLEDRWIDDKTTEQFARVFDTKVMGLRHLLDAVSPDDLAFLALFSSVSGRFGRQGQVDYAMANEVLNKVAQREAATRPSCRVVAIDWGPWDGGMVSPTLKREFARSGVGVISLGAGARSLLEELANGDSTATEVVIGDMLPAVQGVPVSHDRKSPPTTDPALAPVFERRLDIDRHAFLNSHVIGGYPVLPIAVIQEWLGHGALHDNPGLLLGGFTEFRVLKGVILSNGPRDLRVVVSKIQRRGEAFDVDVELRSGPDDAETAHARARAILQSRLPAAPDYTQPPLLAEESYGYTADAAYREVLFHGPHFHGLERIAGYSSGGLVAHLRSAPAPRDWMDDPLRSTWLGDPLIVDTGLQMGILWCQKALGCPSLPTFGARYQQYTATFPTHGVTAALEVRQQTAHRVTGDITFLDANGAVLARMEGYEWTVDPSLRDAFRPLVAQSGGSRSTDVR